MQADADGVMTVDCMAAVQADGESTTGAEGCACDLRFLSDRPSTGSGQHGPSFYARRKEPRQVCMLACARWLQGTGGGISASRASSTPAASK